MKAIIQIIRELLSAPDDIDSWKDIGNNAREKIARDELLETAIRLSVFSQQLIENDIREEIEQKH